jgi:hypothetical protein
MDAATLAELLRETAEHHDHYEKTHAEHQWWDRYAPYLSARQNGSSRRRQQQPPIATWRRLVMFFPDDAVRAFVMKANQLLLTAILASTIAAPIETLAQDKSVVQQMKRAAIQLPVEGELPSLGS